MTFRVSFISSCRVLRSVLLISVSAAALGISMAAASAQSPDGVFSAATSKRTRDPNAHAAERQ